MAIYRKGKAPMELLRYQYKTLFKLSSQQMEEENSADFFTNLLIYGYIQDKQQLDMKETNGRRKN